MSAAARASRAPSQGARVSPELPERAGPRRQPSESDLGLLVQNSVGEYTRAVVGP